MSVKGQSVADTSADWVREGCVRYAKKYGFKETQLDRGLEGLAAHVFVLDEGFAELCSGSAAEDAEPQPSSSRTAAKAATARSTSSDVCAAESCTRMRAAPRGTTG